MNTHTLKSTHTRQEEVDEELGNENKDKPDRTATTANYENSNQTRVLLSVHHRSARRMSEDFSSKLKVLKKLINAVT